MKYFHMSSIIQIVLDDRFETNLNVYIEVKRICTIMLCVCYTRDLTNDVTVRHDCENKTFMIVKYAA